jgi:hypothetical protein
MDERSRDAGPRDDVERITASDTHVLWVPVRVEGGVKNMPISVGVAQRIVDEVYLARSSKSGPVRLWVQGVLARAMGGARRGRIAEATRPDLRAEPEEEG